MEIKMKFTLFAILILLCGCGVRLPSNYAWNLEQAAKTNEKLLEKTNDYPDATKLEIYKEIIQEDTKTLRAVAAAIRAGGGD